MNGSYAIALVALFASASGAPGPVEAAKTWSFDADPSGGPPSGFTFARTGGGPPGRWVVVAETGAPSPPNVLAQVDPDDTDDRYPIAVADAPPHRDLRVSVRCKAVSGRVDQACGLVFRYEDEGRYYLTRANALEDNVRLYVVKDGRRKQIASWKGDVTAGAWHELAVEARGDHIQVSWNGAKVIDHRDATLSEAGRAGLWTKADSVTWFDDLRVSPLPAESAP
jgi:hypothetical protein